MKTKLPRPVIDFSHIMNEAGYECYLVGGAVRNIMAGHPDTDYDFATNATPHEVMKVFRRVIPTGIDHGTVTVLFQGSSFEITTYRAEEDYTDGRHPDRIHYISDIDSDLHRRDFTINAMAYDPLKDSLLDPTGGQEDLRQGIIRAIGNPVERFREDPLRQLRAFRFMGQLEYTIEGLTLKAIEQHKDEILRVSSERIKDELDKLLKARLPSKAFLAMLKTGFLKEILPELSACHHVEQKGYHKYDVLEHSLFACDGAPRDRPLVRWAALLHDIGKVPARRVSAEGEVTFHNHEKESVRLTEKICRRYRFSNKDRDYIIHLIGLHMFHYEPEHWSDGAVRRFLARTGPERVEDLFLLRRADNYGITGNSKPPWQHQNLVDFQDHINRVLQEDATLTVRDLAVNGRDLMSLGIPPGPHMGILLQELLESVLDDPAMNTPAKLLPVAENLYQSMPKKKQ